MDFFSLVGKRSSPASIFQKENETMINLIAAAAITAIIGWAPGDTINKSGLHVACYTPEASLKLVTGKNVASLFNNGVCFELNAQYIFRLIEISSGPHVMMGKIGTFHVWKARYRVNLPYTFTQTVYINLVDKEN